MDEQPDYVNDKCWQAYKRGYVTLEQACRVSANDWLLKGDRVKANAAIAAADQVSE